MNTSKKPIEEQFEEALVQASGANPVFPYCAKQEMGKMIDVIAKGNPSIDKLLATNQSNPVKGGFAAEEFHAETFNLDAVLKNNEARAYTDKSPEWKNLEWNGRQLKSNDNPDIVIADKGKVTHSAQSKYMKDAHDTAGAFSQVKDGEIKYEKNDSYLAPSDQVVGVKDQSLKNIETNKSRNGDPVQREAYQKTNDKVTDTLTDGKSSSSTLTKEEANQLGSGDKSKLKQVENQYQTASTLKQMKQSATNAAALTAIISGSLNTIRYVKLVQDGKISAEDAAYEIVKETACAAADSAVKAGANTGVQSLMVRYGSEKVVIGTFASQGIKSMMKTNVVTVGVVCAIDAVKDLVLLGTGEITEKQFYERQGKGLLTTSSGVVGGSLGFAAAGGVITSMGLAGFAASSLSIVGGLSGGLIAGLAMSLAIENGIEKPYRNLVSNTVALNEAAKELEQCSSTIFHGQIAFTKFLEENLALDKKTDEQMNKIDIAGANALDAILKI